MKLKRLEVAGFRGIREAASIEFGEGFTVISGRNGSGKTSLCDAIEFALTGVLSRGLGGTESGEKLSDYVWWRGREVAHDQFVHLVLENGDDGEFTILRKPGLSVPTQSVLNAELCRTAEVGPEAVSSLCKSFLIRGETLADQVLEMTESDRYGLVREVIGTSDYADAASNVKRARAAVEALHRQRADQYEETRIRLREVLNLVADARAQGEQVLADEALIQPVLKMVGFPVANKLALLKASEVMLGAKSSERGKLRYLLDELRQVESETKEAAAYSEQERVLLSEQSDLTSHLTLLSSSLKDVERRSAEDRGRATAIRELLELGRRVGLQDGHCPLCGSSLSSDEFSRHLASVTPEESPHDEMGEARRLRSRLVDAQLRLDECGHELTLLRARQERSTARRLALDARVLELGGREPVNAEVIEDRIRGLEQEIEQMQLGLTALRALLARESLDNLTERLSSAQSAADEAERGLARIERADHRLKELDDTLRQGSGEILEERLVSVRPVFEELFLRLRPHSDWSEIDYSLRGDIRRFLGLRIAEKLNPRFVFSTGQRRATGLAFLLAIHLSRKHSSWQTLVLDDPVQHIDDYRALHLVEMLSAIRQIGEQVVCTVEDSALADLLCRRLRSRVGEEGVRVDLRYVPVEGVRVVRQATIAPIEHVVLRDAV